MFKDQTWTVVLIVLGFVIGIIGGILDDYTLIPSWPFYVAGGLCVAGGFYGIKAKERK